MSPAACEFMGLLAHLYLQHGKSDRARVLLDALAALRPDDQRVIQSRALATLESGDSGEALRQMESALERFPDLARSRAATLIHSRALLAAGFEKQAKEVWGRRK